MGLTTTGTGKPGNATYIKRQKPLQERVCICCGTKFLARQPAKFDGQPCYDRMKAMIQGRGPLFDILDSAKANHNMLMMGVANKNLRDRLLEYGWIVATETKDIYVLTPLAHSVYDYVLAHR